MPTGQFAISIETENNTVTFQPKRTAISRIDIVTVFYEKKSGMDKSRLFLPDLTFDEKFPGALSLRHLQFSGEHLSDDDLVKIVKAIRYFFKENISTDATKKRLSSYLESR